MKQPVRWCALVILAGVLAACTNLGIFEDVGADPHPPQLQLLGVEYQPAETAVEPEPKTTRPAARAATPRLSSPDGFVVRPNDPATSSVMFRVQYFDAGGDIESIMIRDLDGSLNQALEAVPVETVSEGEGAADTAPTLVYFAGTSGTVDLGYLAFPPGVEGPHRLELWAEDSHGSRSPKVTFTFEFVI